MRAKELILTTTRLSFEDFQGAQSMRVRERLRDNLARAKKFGLNVILVLGATGDEILRLCPELEDADLAFDPNFEGEVFSSIQAGVLAATGAAFVLDVGDETLGDDAWIALDKSFCELQPTTKIDVIELKTQTGAASPQLITIAGLQRLRKLPMQAAWSDRVDFTTEETKSPVDQICVKTLVWPQNHELSAEA